MRALSVVEMPDRAAPLTGWLEPVTVIGDRR